MRVPFIAIALTTSFALAAPLLAQDASRGEAVYEMCLACHVEGGPGPGLNGIVGRKAGAVDGFVYSEALAAAGEKGLVWTEDNLSKFLTDPLAFIPDNKMAFGAVADTQERADLIAFLKTLR